jgi:hypothetical protein
MEQQDLEPHDAIEMRAEDAELIQFTDDTKAALRSLRDGEASARDQKGRIWPGNSRFICGWFIVGPNLTPAVCLWFWISAAMGLWAVFAAAPLWRIYSPVVISTVVTFALSVLIFIFVACADPGIIPRRPSSSPPEDTEGVTNVRWCNICSIEKPTGAYHCQACDNCVLQFDHHCPVFGTCIGGRNITAFRAFLASSSCLFYSVLGTLLILAAQHIIPDDDTQSIYIFAIVITVLMSMFNLSILFYFLSRYFGVIKGAFCCSPPQPRWQQNRSESTEVRRRKVLIFGAEVPHLTVPVSLLNTRREYQRIAGTANMGNKRDVQQM